MGIFEQFPYTNFHDLNLDWILHAIRSMDKKLDEFVASNVLSYADPIQWDIETQYAKNTVVVDPKTGTAYMSINPVPVGQLLTNKYYWQPIFNYDEIVNTLKKQIAAVQADQHDTIPVAVGRGDLVWVANKLYRLTKSLAAGSKIIENENAVPVTVEEIVNDIDARLTDARNLIAQEISDRSKLIKADENNNTVIETSNKLIESSQGREITANGTVNETYSSEYNRTVNGDVIDNVNGEYRIIFPNTTIDVRKLLSTFKNVKYYGAVGDGITDDTNAFTSSLTEQGCAIVPDGVFKANIKLNSHTSIIGLGEQSVIIPNTSGTPIISTESGCLGCTIKNLHLKGDKKSDGIFIDKGNGFIIDNVLIEECHNGILVEDKTPGYGRLTHISNTYVYNCMSSGILVSKYYDISLINCECVSCSGKGQNAGYNCIIANGAFKMINCHFWNQNDYSGLYRPYASFRIENCSDFEITNCHIEGGYTYNLIIDKSIGRIVNSLIYATFGAYSIRYNSEDCYFIGCTFNGQADDDVSYKPEFKAVFSNGDVANFTNFIGCTFNTKLVDTTVEFWQILGCVNNDSTDLVTLLGQNSYVSCVAFNENIKYTNIENLCMSQNVRQGNCSWLENDTTLTGNWYPGCKHYIYNGSGNTITITTNYKTEQTFQVETHKFICLIATDWAVCKLS